MKTWDLKEHIKYEIKNNKETFLTSFKNSVAKEVGKVKIKYDLETKPYKFRDGETADIAKKLTITIDFKNAVVQPHSHFEDDFCAAVTEALTENVNGLMENWGQQ